MKIQLKRKHHPIIFIEKQRDDNNFHIPIKKIQIISMNLLFDPR